MRYLLDTHVFLWLDADPGKLSERVAAICADQSNMLLLSIARVWELQIKLQLGKLKLNSPLVEVIAVNLVRNRLRLLPITLEHILGLGNLPHHHRDPFDRILVAQTISEKLILLSDDRKIAAYSVEVIW